MPQTRVPGRVSVIVPLYNYGHFICSCLDSALAQDYPDVEIIVVDDGSTDAGPERVRGYADRGVRLVEQVRCGYGCARAVNRGIRESTGEFVAWLSADDRFTEGRLSRQVAQLQAVRRHDPRVGVAFTATVQEAVDEAALPFVPLPAETARAIWERDGCVRWKSGQRPEIVRDLPRLLIQGCLVHGCSTLIPRIVLDDVGLLDESLPRTSDYEMWLRLMAAGYHVAYDDTPGVVSRLHAVNTADWNHEVLFESHLVRRHYRRNFDVRTFVADYDALPAEERARLHGELGDHYWRESAIDLALDDYLAMAACGDHSRQERVERARQSLRRAEPVVGRTGEGGASPCVLLPMMAAGGTARMGQVLRLLLPAVGGNAALQLWIWTPVPELAPEAARCIQEVGRTLGSSPAASAIHFVRGDLSETLARVQAVVPLGMFTDLIPIEMARRMGVPVIYRLEGAAVAALRSEPIPSVALSQA